MKRLAITALTVALLALPAVAAPAGAATPTCKGVPATIVGNDKPNLIRGTAGRDVIVAKGGRDKIYGNGGNDLICAGKGNDVVFGGSGKDKILGQTGRDVLKGGAGNDRLDGGPDTDGCYTNAGGGTTVRCEPADLRVRVSAPETVEPGQGNGFNIFVDVWNIGGKPAADVQVVIDYDETNVVCRLPMDPTGTKTPGKLVPRQYWAKGWSQYCQVPIPNTVATVTMSAKASTTSPEANKANNADDSLTTVIVAP